MGKYLENIKLKLNDNNILINILIILAIFGSPFSLLIKIFTLKVISFDYINPFFLYRILLSSFIFYLFFKLKNKFNSNYIGLVLVFLIFYVNILTNNTFEITNKLNSEYLLNNENISKFFEDRNKSLLINFFNIFLIIILFNIKSISIDFKYLKKKIESICKIFLFMFILISIIWIFQNYLNKTNSINYLISEAFLNDNFWINSHYIAYMAIINFVLFLDEFSKKNFLTTIVYTILVISLKLNIAIYIMIFLFIVSYLMKNYKFNILILITNFVLIISLPIIYYISTNFFNFSNLSYFEHLSLSIDNRINIYKFYLDNIKGINIFFGNSLFNHDIATYPHNLVLDIFYTTGLVGLLIFFIVSYNILKGIFNSKNFFVMYLFFSFLMFSSLSGYFFFNIFLITTFLISIQLVNEK